MEGSDRIGGDEVDEVTAELDAIFDEIHQKRRERELRQQQEYAQNFRVIGTGVSGNSEDGFGYDDTEGTG